MVTGLRMYSLGIVSEHKKPSSISIKAHPAEVFTEINGELRSVPLILYSAGVDGENREYQVQIEADTSLECEWLHLEEYQQIPPSIRRGEQVIIWEIEGSTDGKYYWTSIGRNQNLRRLDSALWAFSNISNPEEDVKELNHENAYTVEVSTHTKQISIRTNKYDGEPFAYTVQINAKDGTVTITDDTGNYYQLVSEEKLHDLTNADGTFLRLDKKNIKAYAPDSMIFEAVEKIDLKCKDYVLVASNSITTESKTVKHTAETVELEAKSVTYKSDTVKLDAPTVEATGLFKCKTIDVGSGAMKAGSDGIELSKKLTAKAVKAESFEAPGGKWHMP